jgi:flagellar biogenesis protein FliO
MLWQLLHKRFLATKPFSIHAAQSKSASKMVLKLTRFLNLILEAAWIYSRLQKWPRSKGLYNFGF